MAAYAALSSVKTSFTVFLHYFDAALPPEQLNVCERAREELKRVQDFVERLDSRSRKRMSVSLARIVEAVNEFYQRVESDNIDDVVEHTPSLLDTLRKVQEECCSLLEDEDEEEEVVSLSSKMIGLRDERRKLKEAIFDDWYIKESVFLLAGMAGIGKTTLAREVYDDMDVSEWFECRAWVTLGNEWKSKEITEAILGQVDPESHKMGGDEEEITQRLKESLKLAKRCLIMVDDVWDYDVFPDYMERILPHNVKRILPHDVKRSRVVLTTRIKDSRFMDQWYVFEKRLLNKEESWNLLREKVFGGGSCPPRLEKTGKKIAEKCDGLPLTIVTVANLLSKVDHESVWIDIAEKKRHKLFTDAYDQISKVLYPSYKALRDELKLCFLYMGVFPIKYEIHRSKLINLWTAEKIFNQFEEESSLYLTFIRSIMHLDNCSLVMVYKRSTTYSLLHRSRQAIRICGLHSSWWYFCQREARKINFFHVIDCPEDALEESINGHSRLSIHNNVLFARKDVYKSIEENCASTAQSLLCFGPYHQYMVPICFGLKSLQRLDALNIRFYEFPLEVLELPKLMYLALTCNRQLPPSISKLEKLQYLIVHPHLSIHLCGVQSYMPMEIWDLEELKHLQVMGSDLPDPGNRSLRMLSTLLDVSTTSLTILNKLPNLEKLRIRIELTPEAPYMSCCFDHISYLMKIEALTCIVVNPGFKFPIVPPIALFSVLPSSLKKLSLSGLGYSWEEMRPIATLESLQVLKLKFNAFHGQIWEVKKLDFPDLRLFLIEDLDLVKLKGGPGSFRNLQHLSITHCYKLEKIRLGDCEKLSRIEVVDCNPLVEKSIKKFIFKAQRTPKHLSVHYSWKSA